MAEPLTIEEALAAVLERARPLDGERVPLSAAGGRVLAADAAARVDLPPFASSAMDGYALRADDTPGRLPVVFRIAAGRPAPTALRAGEAMAIATGGAVPENADVVLPLEYVDEHDNAIEVQDPLERGLHVRPRGGDISAGSVVVPAGVRLGPAQIGALAAAGVAEVACARRPRATLVVTGTELRRPGEALGAGQIYESNGPMLETLLAAAGAEVERLDAVVDESGAHRDALGRALAGADVVVTSGGVSVGPHDLVRAVGDELGVESVFWGVAVKPGKPLAFGVSGDTLVFGLPGNPVSALVGAELFVRPALLALQGAAAVGPAWLHGVLARGVRRNAGRDELVRARSRAEADAIRLEPVTGQESHMIARAAAADTLVHVPRGDGELEAGTAVRYLQLG